MPLQNNALPQIDMNQLMARLKALGNIGRDSSGALIRLAASDSDKAARDQLVMWMRDAGLDIHIDQIGNIFGVWARPSETAPLMMGSHIDTVVNAGIYDGPYGVLAGLSVVEAMRAAHLMPDRSLVVAAFTNEEGARFAPDMMGSLVYAGGLGLEDALTSKDQSGVTLGEELSRIGYAGRMKPGSIVPSYFLELHIEQGPVLENEGLMIGAVKDLQGISWQHVTIEGVANHAGTTPTSLRRDAGLSAAKVITFLRSLALNSNSVATVGKIKFWPDVINVVPSKASFTIDLRDPDDDVLKDRERAVKDFLGRIQAEDGVQIETQQLARFDPVVFDPQIVSLILECASEKGFGCRCITSGAGHDAQMMARICPSAMIFVPSQGGVSHNPREYTAPEALAAGAEVLLDTVCKLTVPNP